MLTIDYHAEQDRFLIYTKQNLPAIGEWGGWARMNPHCYAARAWVSSVLSVKAPTGIQLTWSEPAAAQRDKLLRDLNAARSYLSGGQLPLRPPVPTEREPKTHQWQAIFAMRAMRWRCQLGDDMGLGKTSAALWATEDSGAQTLLVVSPVSAKHNWKLELEVTLGARWTAIVFDGTRPQRASQLADAMDSRRAGHPTAMFMNYDLLRHLTDEQLGYVQLFVRGGMVVFDECHYLKNRDSDRSTYSKKIADPAEFVLGLSGTPIRNLADDLFSQVEIIRPGTWTSYRDFAKRFLVIQAVDFGKRTVQKVVGAKNLDELNAVMNTLQIRRKKNDVLNLPPKIRTFPQLELTGDLLAFYKAMKDYARIELQRVIEMNTCPDCKGKGCDQCGSSGSMRPGGPGAISIFNPRAKSAVEAAMRCEQIAQGFVGGIPDPLMAKLDVDLLKGAEKIEGRPNELIFPNAPKLQWLLEAVETCIKQGGAPAVLSRFNAPMFWLERKLASMGIKAGVMHGALSSTEKDDMPRLFQEGRMDVLIAQVKMCEGFNATRCQDVLFLGRDWSLAINEQGEDRFYRMTSKGTVNVQIPIVQRTVEVMIDRRLRAKGADAEQALRTVTVQELMEAL